MIEDFIELTGYATGSKIYIKYDQIKAIKQAGEPEDQYYVVYLNGIGDYFKVRETLYDILEEIENLKKSKKTK
jgi:hypothetical protein